MSYINKRELSEIDDGMAAISPAASPLPPLMRVLVFQLLFWAWFAPYQWALWKPIKSEIVTAQLHAGWAGLFLETTWVKAVMTLFIIVLSARFLDRRPLRDYGYAFTRRWFGRLGLGFFLGLAWNSLPRFVDWAAGGAHLVDASHVGDQAHAVGAPFAFALLPGIVSVLLTGFWEETIFRAHPMKNMAEGLRFQGKDSNWALPAVVLPTALYFGFGHLVNGLSNVPAIVFAITAGIILGSLYWVTGELALPIGFHAGTDFCSFSLFQTGATANTCVFHLADAGRHFGVVGTIWFLGTAAFALMWAQGHTTRYEERTPLRTRKEG